MPMASTSARCCRARRGCWAADRPANQGWRRRPASTMDAVRAARLLETNEKLVLAVIRAQDDAAASAQALRDFAHTARFASLAEQADGALLFDRLAHALAVARRQDDHLGLLFVSLDNYREITDTLGHARGDRVARLAAQRLSAAVRGSDTVS